MCIIKTATTTIILATLACCELSYKANANPNVALQKDSTPALEQVLDSRKFTAADLAQAPTLTDIEGNWARGFITALVSRGVIQGFPDGSFRPNEPVTRAQFAAIVSKAFPQNTSRQAIAFADVPEYYWAKDAIQTAYQTGFLAGYPNNTFLPEQNIPRVQVMVALANGLNLSAAEPSTLLATSYQDAAEIPDFARSPVAAATANRLVVNYPDKSLLQPNQIATRADVAAFVYQALASKGEVPQLTAADPAAEYIVGLQPITTPPSEAGEPPLSAADIQKLQSQLQALQETNDFGNIFQGSPGITVAVPSGFGPDRNTIFFGATYQASTRQGSADDGAIGFGIGLGDARKNIGVELGYALASVTADYTGFGEGGFNIRLHRQLPQDWAIAVGYNNIIEIAEDNDFDNSVYGVATKVFRTRPNVNSPLSRVAINVGVGNGQFRSGGAIDNDNDDAFNVFGSVALRVAQPASLIAEWTGQDLALGLSITPIKKSSWVITPAIRDVAGAGDEVRFVLGTGFSFRF